MRTATGLCATLLLAAGVGLACSRGPAGDAGASASSDAGALAHAAPREAHIEINPRLLRRFQALPASFEDDRNARTPAKVELGRMLYFDKRLSKDGDSSCNTCHDLGDYGVDHQRFSTGHRMQRGARNSPTVYDAAGLFAQFWDGRASSIEEQAKGPLLEPAEMAMGDGAHVVAVLAALPGYVDAFRRAFPGEADPVTFDNVARALGAFERGLVTPSRWDLYLRGDTSALTAGEMEGLKTFLDVGCVTCHTGRLIGGSMFERVGVAEPWPNQADRGREAITHAPGDAMMFKVPSLRNVVQTAPYFHDGSAATLPEAVRMMGRYQLGLELGDDEVGAIVTWLTALTGEVPRGYVAAPSLPERGHE